MSIIDTHTHLYLEDFDPNPAETVRRALDAGVSHMVFPNVGLDSIPRMKKLHDLFPEVTSMAMGLHPTEINESADTDFATVLTEFNSNPTRWVAVGEIGMDLYWDKTFSAKQMDILDRQLALAEQHNLPVIIHCREALDETLEVFEGHRGMKGVFHSFGGTKEDVERIRNIAGDFYFGINGIVTFKKCPLFSVLPDITPERILLETDAPYLAPVPMRGKQNESAYIVHTAQFIADKLGVEKEALAGITTANAKSLFKI
ncbi:MAG: TatD family hydrolase [Paramuribaculum sp.]|nr:TatD family hydrolase [Paramuribaculum sp.]